MDAAARFLRSELVRNEQIKLLANALNTAATSSFTVGVLAPIAAAVYTNGASVVSARLVAIAATIWISAAVILHYLAQRVLRRLR